MLDFTLSPVAPAPLPGEDTRLYPGGGPSQAGASRLSAATHCDRWFAYRYGLDRFRGGSAAQAGGSLVHAGLAQHYARVGAAQKGGIIVAGEHVTDPERLGTIAEAIGREAAARGVEPDADLVVDSRECVEQYAAHYRYDDRALTILHVEEVFSARFPCTPHAVTVLASQAHVLNPAGVVVARAGEGPAATVTVQFTEYLWTTRIDLAFGSGGKVVICDHKTTARIETKHPRIYALTSQMAGLRWLGNHVYGARFGGVLLNMVQRETPRKFTRPTMDAAPSLARDFPQHVADVEARIEANAVQARPFAAWPTASNEHACYSRYGRCSAADTCLWGAE